LDLRREPYAAAAASRLRVQRPQRGCPAPGIPGERGGARQSASSGPPLEIGTTTREDLGASAAADASVPRHKFVVFPGAWTRLTPADIGPRTTGTQPDVVERQITTIHPGNPRRICDAEH
jgi:hypothetical protein